MKIVILLFACVALLDFAKIGASCDDDDEAGRGGGGPPKRPRTIIPNPNPVRTRNDGGPAGRGRRGTALRNTQPEVSARNIGGPASRGISRTTLLDTVPVLRAWTDHAHSHSTEIQNAGARYPHIDIKRVVNRHIPDWHLLSGDLVPNSNITSCNGPHGYAIVDLVDSERLYACIRPEMCYQESIDRDHAHCVPVFLAKVCRPGRPELEADLAPRGLRSRLNSNGHLFHGEHEIRRRGLQSVGHVRYIKSDPIHPIDVEGDLYHFPETEEERLHRIQESRLAAEFHVTRMNLP